MKRLLALSIMSLSVQAQQWLETTLYPFENKFLQLDAGLMQHVDEGEGDIILCVHGTPAWSFLYKEHIAELSKKDWNRIFPFYK